MNIFPHVMASFLNTQGLRVRKHNYFPIKESQVNKIQMKQTLLKIVDGDHSYFKCWPVPKPVYLTYRTGPLLP